MPGILFCSISRGPTILCSKQRAEGNFDSVAESMVHNISPASNTRTTYTGDNNYLFHVVVQGGVIYLCATDASFRKARAFAFLDEVMQKFTGGTLIVRSSTAGHMELQQDFANVLSSSMNRFSKDEGDNIAQLQSQVNEVKGVMTQNIEKVLERGEKLEDLISKSADLEAHSMTFQKTSRQVARKFWWQNLKMKIIIAVVVLVVLLGIVLIVLSQTGAFSGGKHDASSTTAAPGVVTTTTAPAGR